MRRHLLSTLTLLLIATPSLAQSRVQQNDWLIIPGERAGSIQPTTTHADLIRIFGPANVRDKSVDTGEGPEAATVIFPGQRDRTIAILWRTPTDQTTIRRIIFCSVSGWTVARTPCLWHTTEGVTLGTTMTTLLNLNGAPFAIQPWGNDAGPGGIRWQQGKLAAAWGDNLAVSLSWPEKSRPNSAQDALAAKVVQMTNPTSETPELQKLNPKVVRLEMMFSQ